MLNIAIIGAGQIGSRHLQALTLVKESLLIQVIDPSSKSLTIAKKRFKQVNIQNNSKCEVEYHTDIDKLKDQLDVVIIATNSNVRKKIIDFIVNNKMVRYLILEKFLFSNINDYEGVENLLKGKNIKTWVNCPRRMYPFYKKLKKIVTGQQNIQFIVSGSNWELGTNTIHMLDLFSFISGTSELTLSNDYLLDDEIIASKRIGHVEFTGTIEGKSNKGDKFSFTSYRNGSSPFFIFINTNQFHFVIQEGIEGIALSSNQSNNWKWETEKFTVPPQSQLTNIVIEDLINKSTCDLPTYEESAKHHTVFLNFLLNFIQKKEINNTSECLIT